jgi:serine/threonine protein kinase
VSAELREGQAFGGYQIVELVGTGGMGLVYRAEQRILGRTVALKVIRPEIAEYGDYRSRFLREARLAAAVDHPNVVSVFDCGEQDGRLYLTMQWVDGVDLGTLLEREQRLAPERAVRIGVQMAGALQAVHDAGLVHRDVKPANILVRDIGGQDHAYLTDFGIAKVPAAQDKLTRSGLMLGTPGYLSPEQIRGQQATPRSDLYALGCVIFEALTGQRPFRGENELATHWAHASSPRPLASGAYPALGDGYDAFFMQALAVDPQDRFSSGRAFAEALQSAYSGSPGGVTRTAATPDAPVPRAYRPSPGPSDAPRAYRPLPGPTPGAREYRPFPEPTPGAQEPRPSPGPAPGAPREHRPSPGAPAAPRPARPAPRAAAPRPASSGASWFGRLVVLTGALVFAGSVTVLTNYINNGTGWKSLWQATHNDPASPLFPHDFWILVALAILALVFTGISAAARQRLVMIGAALASLGLIGYTLYLPSKGRAPGFQPYGTSYWVSLAAAAVMMIGAVIALAARSRAPRPPAGPRATRQDPVRGARGGRR